MSRGALGTWFSCIVIIVIYGILEKCGSSFWLSAGAGIIIGLIPLYFTDRFLRRKA